MLMLFWGQAPDKPLDKPSPIPERSRRSASAKRSAAKSTPEHASPTGETRAKTGTTSNAEQTGGAGETTKQTGTACYFTSRMDGGLTASGEPSNSDELVASHASYPLGSRVLVTNLANGKSVEVRIVDRFPKKSGRVINLSESAARKLDFIAAGTTEVSLQLY